MKAFCLEKLFSRAKNKFHNFLSVARFDAILHPTGWYPTGVFVRGVFSRDLIYGPSIMAFIQRPNSG